MSSLDLRPYNENQFPLLHNAVGWSYICFIFLYSSLKIQRQHLSPQMGKNKETGDDLKQSLSVSERCRRQRRNEIWKTKQHGSLAKKYMHVK